MQFYSFTVVLLILRLHNVRSEVDEADWVDPEDMSCVSSYSDDHTDISLGQYKPPVNKRNEDDCDRARQTEAYFKRTINMLLNALHKNPHDESLYNIYLKIETDVDKYKKLKEYTAGEFLDLIAVDKILSEFLKKPPPDYIEEYFTPFILKIFYWMISEVGILVICTIAYLFVGYKLIRSQLYSWQMVQFALFTVLLWDFCTTWGLLYQKAEIDKTNTMIKYKDAPAHCHLDAWSITGKIFNIFNREDVCKKYYETLMVDTFWKITPGMVIGEMFRSYISYIFHMEAIGKSVGGLVAEMLYSLPWGINIILLPVLLIFFAIMVCILLSFIFQVPLKFNFFHLISFSFGDKGRSNYGNMLTGNTVDKMLDLVKDQTCPRTFIQNIGTKIISDCKQINKIKPVANEHCDRNDETTKNRNNSDELNSDLSNLQVTSEYNQRIKNEEILTDRKSSEIENKTKGLGAGGDM